MAVQCNEIKLMIQFVILINISDGNPTYFRKQQPLKSDAETLEELLMITISSFVKNWCFVHGATDLL